MRVPHPLAFGFSKGAVFDLFGVDPREIRQFITA
jgi:hypothetical protein